MRSYGYYKSPESTLDFNASLFIPDGVSIPSNYKSRIDGDILNQGSTPCCVACAIYDMYYFYCFTHNKSIDIKYIDIFNNRSDKSLDGMYPRDGFDWLHKNNKILRYGRIFDLDTLKRSIIMNGPSLIALPVRTDSSDYFWRGNKNLGGHAVSFIGYTEDSLLLKNSWGYDYGNNGIIEFPYSDINCIQEIWTILN